MAIEKIKILGALLELPAKQHIQFGQFEVNGLDWQRCLAGSSKTAPRIFIFSIFLGAEYLSYLNSIATFALTFFGYIISVLASVNDNFINRGFSIPNGHWPTYVLHIVLLLYVENQTFFISTIIQHVIK